MKIYTKTGDTGQTSLSTGERVSKTDPRVEAYGTTDELMAFTALLSDKLADDAGLHDYVGDLNRILDELMYLAAAQSGAEAKALDVKWLEGRIDALQATLPPWRGFTLPGGHKDASLCHVCRTVCRRAERASLRAGLDTAYLNRLSDYFYLLSRSLMAFFHLEERMWKI